MTRRSVARTAAGARSPSAATTKALRAKLQAVLAGLPWQAHGTLTGTGTVHFLWRWVEADGRTRVPTALVRVSQSVAWMHAHSVADIQAALGATQASLAPLETPATVVRLRCPGAGYLADDRVQA